MIPITFLTGFYVTQVVARYWDQFMSLPWPDKFALKIVSYIPGKVCVTLYYVYIFFKIINFSVDIPEDLEKNSDAIRQLEQRACLPACSCQSSRSISNLSVIGKGQNST